MKKCPNCKSPNDERNAFCISCGHDLKTPTATRSFRNFIITISIIFSVILTVLIILFFTNTGLADAFLHKNTAGSSEVEAPILEDNDIDTAALAGVSPDQKKVLLAFGYPDQFIVLFDEGAGNKRIDSWMYADMEVCFIFEDGEYTGSSDYIVEDPGRNGYTIKPYELKYGMGPSDVELILGEKGEESLEEETGLKLLTFGQGLVICVFNNDDMLIGASKNNLSADLY